MLDMGMTYPAVQEMVKTLLGDRQISIGVTLMDLDHNALGPLSGYFYDGQVTVNAASETTRSASLTLFDPQRDLVLDGINPVEGALYYDKMVRIIYRAWKPRTLTVYEIPVFTGPITDMSRNGVFIDITCLGKEVLGLGAMWVSRFYNTGTRKYDIIRDLLENVMGEVKLDLTYRGEAIAAPISYVPESKPWAEASLLANSMGLQLFYDGRGVARMRQRPTSPVFTFEDGDGGSLVSRPLIKYDSSKLKNAVLVRGAEGVVAQSMAPATHPFNHLKLGRTRKDGTRAGRVLLELVEDSSIASPVDAQFVSDTKLAELLLQGIGFSADTAVIPMLEEDDYCLGQLKGEYSLPFRSTEFTIPLSPGQNATVGSNQNVKIKRR